MSEQLRESLRHLASKATQGEWWIDSHGHTMVSFDGGVTHTVFMAKDLVTPAVRHPETGNLSHWPNDWDASYIATANPANILTLLADFDTLAQRLQEAERLLGLISSKGLSPSLTDVELEEIDAFLAGKGGKS